MAQRLPQYNAHKTALTAPITSTKRRTVGGTVINSIRFTIHATKFSAICLSDELALECSLGYSEYYAFLAALVAARAYTFNTAISTTIKTTHTFAIGSAKSSSFAGSKLPAARYAFKSAYKTAIYRAYGFADKSTFETAFIIAK